MIYKKNFLLKNMKVFVVMPAYNAAKTLEETYNLIPKDNISEIVLVDDFSKDNTVEIAKQLPITVITHSRNRGYGGNQKTCYNYSLKQGADIIVMIHPDNQYDPTIINQLVLPIKEGKADVVFASRFLYDPIKGGPLQGGMPLYKFVFNKFLTFVENKCLGTYFSEFHTGYRAFSAEILKKIPYWTNSEDFVFDNDIIIQLLNVKARFKEIPVDTKYFIDASSINFKRSCKYGIEIFILLFKRFLFNIGLVDFAQFDFIEKQINVYNENNSIKECPNCRSFQKHIIIHGYPKWEGVLYKCENCGLVYYNKFMDISIEQKYRNFYNDSGKRFNSIFEFFIKIFRKARYNYALKFISGNTVQKKIFDIATDRGLFLNFFKEKGWTVSGNQINANAVDYIKKKYAIDIYKEDFLDIDFKNDRFDVITAFHILEHVSEPFAYIKKIYGLLNQDGIFILEVPNFEHRFRIFYGSRWFALDIPNHLYHFDRNFLSEYLKKNNFDIIAEQYFSFEFSIFNVIQSWLNLWHSESNILFNKILRMKSFKMIFSSIFYKEIIIIIISIPFIIYQILKLYSGKNGDTIRLVCKKK